MSIASDQGFLTGFWTVNKSKHIEKAIKHGTNSITTDYPNKAIKVIRAIKAEQLIAMNPDIYRANLPGVAKSLTDQTIAPEPELVSGD
jgi:hypothetical protein